MTRRPLLLFLVSLSLILAPACSPSASPTPPAPASPTPALPTLTASPLPPTLTPTPSAPATPTPQTACTDKAVFLADVTIPDDTVLKPAQPFVKTWRLKNTGTCTWNSTYRLVFSSGEAMNAPQAVPLAETRPQETLEISLSLVAPTDNGRFTGVFQLHNPAGQIIPIGGEDTVWVRIVVGTVSASVTQPGSTPPLPTTASGAGNTSCQYNENAAYISQIVSLINNARAEAGLPALTVNSQLTIAAQGHAVDMACHSLLSHTGSDGSSVHARIVAAGYSPSRSEEIIYAGGDPQTAFNWWMNDPPHRAAILNPQSVDMGVGYAYVETSQYGGYFTVDFATP